MSSSSVENGASDCSGFLQIFFCVGVQVANSWRTTKDISLSVIGTWDGIVHNLVNNGNLARYGGPGMMQTCFW
jgi:hypothetical protein